MKNIIIISILLISFMPHAVLPADPDSSGTEKDEIELIVDNLESAFDNRNFKVVKEELQKLVPIMKEDIKGSKKDLHALEKSDNPPIDPSEYAEMLNRKHEIYDSVKDLMDVSPAAIRARSTMVIEMIKEYHILRGKG